MSDRILIDVGRILDEGAGNDELGNALLRELRDIADELNSGLAEYEVSVMFLDTGAYLCIVRLPSPDAGSYWAELAEEREEQEAAVEATTDARQ